MPTSARPITVAIAIAAFDDWGVRLSEAGFSGCGAALNVEHSPNSTPQQRGIA